VAAERKRAKEHLQPGQAVSLIGERNDQAASRFHQGEELLEDGKRVRKVLEDFQGNHGIKSFRLERQEALRGIALEIKEASIEAATSCLVYRDR